MRLPRKFSQKSRKLFYFIHLWTGLILGLWLVMMGLTGSILSWKTELNEWQVRQSVSAPIPDTSGETIPVSRAIEALKAANPDLTPERGITLPTSKRGYYLHQARGEVNGERVSQMYLVDPVTAKVYPPVVTNDLIAEVTERIHHNLLIGVKGTVTNGFLTFFTLFLLASGIWLWWPSNMKQLKKRILWERGISLKRTLYDLHNIMGVYLFWLLFLVTLTGVLICYNGQTDQSIAKAINRSAGVEEQPRERRGEGGGRRGREGRREVSLVSADGRQPLPIDVLVEKARTALPNNPLVQVRMPRRPDQPFLANYEFIRITDGGVPFDLYTGKRLDTKIEAAFGRPPTPGATFMGAVFHLHYGWFAGNWSKILYCISGFLPLGLFITGIWMWINKKRKMAQKHQEAIVKNQRGKTKLKKPKAA